MSILKKMSVSDEMLETSPNDTEIHNFFDFVWKVHEATECIKPECEIACFIIPLKEVLFNLNKDYKTYQKKKRNLLLNV